MAAGYDIIGDIHAQAGRLKLLLAELGYTGPYYSHPEGRRVIFLGDFINRGPENRETLHIVRQMTERGAMVVMGNHEFKAICYARPGVHGYIRPHTLKNAAEHAGFIDEFKFGSVAHKSAISWFERLPVRLELPEFRVVHACWSEVAYRNIGRFIKRNEGTLKESAYGAYDTENDNTFSRSFDELVRGPRYKLPRGISILDSQGQVTKESRLLWWKQKGTPAPELLDKGEQIGKFLSNWNKKNISTLRNRFNYQSQLPVFIGHYNLLGEPEITSDRVVCLNFKDRLVAYRWDEGDKKIYPDQLVYV